MTTQPSKNPLPPTVFVMPGDTIDSWCSTCKTSTPHRYEPLKTRKLVCVRCETNGVYKETQK